MQRKMKSSVSFLLALSMVASLMAPGAFAAGDELGPENDGIQLEERHDVSNDGLALDETGLDDVLQDDAGNEDVQQDGLNTEAPVMDDEGSGEEEELTTYAPDGLAAYHVANNIGDDVDGDGTADHPFLTIGRAVEAGKAAGQTDITVVLDTDVESGLELKFDEELDVTITSGDVRRKLYYTGTRAIGTASGFVKVTNGTVRFDNVVLSGSTGEIDGRVVYAAEYGSVVLNDVLVTNGRVNNTENVTTGGSAVFADKGGNVTLMGGTEVTRNTTTGYGAIYVDDGGFVTVQDDVTISDNTALEGGAIYAVGQSSDSEGGLAIMGSVEISGNKITGENGAGLYIEKDANASVSGDVTIHGNLVAKKQNNVYLAPEATLDIAGATVGANIGISADPEFAYRLVSLPVGYEIQGTKAGDEKGWSDDCDAWDIRYMTYKGVPGLYLYYKTISATFEDVDTLTGVNGEDINGEVVDYKDETVPGSGTEGGVLTVPDVIAKGDGEDFVIDFTCDPDEYRIPTQDVVVIRDGDRELTPGEDYTYTPDFENGTGHIVIPSDVKDALTGPVEFEISAEKLYTLTVTMNGPLFALSDEGIVDNRFSMAPLNLSESVKTGTTAHYKLTRNGAGVAGIGVTLYESNGVVAGDARTDADGVVEFEGLKEAENYYIVVTYSEEFRVISRDVLKLTLSTLLGQTLSADYGNTTGDVSYDKETGKATVSNVKADGTVFFNIEQAKDLIHFVANTENAMNRKGEIRPAFNGDEAVLSMETKEMPGNANTYGTLATAELAGYEFLGWYDAPVDGDLVTAGTAYTKGASATTLYAHWQARNDVAFTVKHFVELADGGVNMRHADGVETVEFGGKTYYLYETKAENDGEADEAKDLTGKTLTEADMTEAECSWWTRNGFTPVFDEPYVVSPKGNSVFNVMYDRNVYAIHFENNGQEGSEAKVPESEKDMPDGEVKFGDNYGELPTPTLPGYEFAGWYDESKTGEEGLVTESTIHKTTDDITLTAHWNAKRDTKWAIKVVTEDIAQYSDGESYKPGTYSVVKTVYQDNDGELLVGTTDTEVEFTVADIRALTMDGFTFKGYSDKFDNFGLDVIETDGTAKVFVKPTDMSTDLNGLYNDAFDGGIVYLFYTRDTVKVIFKDDKGGDTEEEIIHGGDFEGKFPEDPKTDGYDFQGWVDKDGKPVTPETPADEYVKEGETVELTPTWKARKYNLTYVPGVNAKFILGVGVTGTAEKSTVVEGGYIDPHQVEYDQPMGVMPSGAKPGYVFDGWTLKGQSEFITSETNVDITNVVISNAPTYEYENTRPLYAKYTPHVYTLVFDAGKSTVTDEVGVVSPERVQVTFDSIVSGIPTPTLRGYKFMGWVLADKPEVGISNGMIWNRVYTNGAEIPVKAVWVPENYRYTFNLNDQTGSTRGQLVDTTIDYVEETFDSVYDRIFAVEAIRPGYDFKGWSLLPTGEVLKAEDLVKLSENRTLYAIWEPKLYDVTLIMKGGRIADLTDNNDLNTYDPSATYEIDEDTQVITSWTIKIAFDSVYGELPVPVKDDCVYHGYLADAAGWPAKEGYGVTIHEQVITALPQYIDFTDYDNDPINGVNKGITLTAVLEPYFTFNPDGGKFVEDDSTEPKKELQSDIDALPEVEKEGYTHKGWQDEDGNPVTLEDVKNGEEPKELKPIYVPNVTLDPDGGKFKDDGTTDPKEIPVDELDKLPDVEKPGYVQEGWVDEDGNPVTEEDIKNSEEPITVKPAFFASIIMDANGGLVNGKARDEVRLSTLESLPTLSRSSYTFNGWYTEQNGGTQVNLAALKEANVHVTVWAHWTYSGGGGGGGGGYTPTPRPDHTPIEEPKTPLAGLDMLTDDHIAYIAGFPDGTVRPLANITRAEVAMIFYRLLREETRAIYKTDVSPFTDVAADAWYTTAIATLANADILAGRGNGIFDPEAQITRAEFATICARFDDLELNEDISFPDVDKDHWAYAYIMSAAAKGWVKGFEDGTFGPEKQITRAEVMTLVNRVLKRATEPDQLEMSKATGDPIHIWPDNKNPYQWFYVPVMEATHGHDNDSKFDSNENLVLETWTEIVDSPVGNE